MKPQNTRYLAINISSEIDECIALYGAVRGQTKSRVVRDILRNWKAGKRLVREDLIKDLGERINKEWKIREMQQQVDARMRQFTKQEFLDQQREKMKNIPDATVLEALKLCGYGTD